MRATAAEAEARTTQVAEWLMAGWSRAKICEYARENEGWGLSDSQIDRYIAKARELVRSCYEKDWEARRAVADARLESLYGQAVEKGDLRLALSVIKEQIALQGTGENSAASYRDNTDFMACFYTYAEALRTVLPPDYLNMVVEATRHIAPVAESLEEAEVNEELLQLCVEDHKTLGRGRTREELIEAGVFDGVTLPD